MGGRTMSTFPSRYLDYAGHFFDQLSKSYNLIYCFMFTSIAADARNEGIGGCLARCKYMLHRKCGKAYKKKR